MFGYVRASTSSTSSSTVVCGAVWLAAEDVNAWDSLVASVLGATSCFAPCVSLRVLFPLLLCEQVVRCLSGS